MRAMWPLKKFDATDHPALPMLNATGADGTAQAVSTAPIKLFAEITLSLAFIAAAIFAADNVVTVDDTFNGAASGLSAQEVPVQDIYSVVPKVPTAPISTKTPWL